MKNEKETCKTVWNVQNSFISQTAKQDTNHSLLVADFAHTSEMVDNTQQNERMYNDIFHGIFCRRHY